jgi:hypothetical protein
MPSAVTDKCTIKTTKGSVTHKMNKKKANGKELVPLDIVKKRAQFTIR